jgi:hypothetical protein
MSNLNAFLLHHPKTRTTGTAIARALGIPCTINANRAKFAYLKNVIVWGSLRELPVSYRSELGYAKRTILNSQNAVKIAGSKLKALSVLQNHNIPVPRFATQADIDKLAKWFEEGVEFVLGRDYRHSRGTDINIFHIEDLDVLKYGISDYYLEYIEPYKEYRIQVVNGEVLFNQKKYFRPELFSRLQEELGLGDAFLEESKIIRNNDHGWGFHDVQDPKNVPTAVKNASIRAVNALGLTFGAVDVIWVGSAKASALQATWGDLAGAYVLEVNTAPGLRDRNVLKYAEAFRKVLEQ